MAIKIKHHAPADAPIKQVEVTNAEGYFDLIVNKNKNGKALRISDKHGDNRVHVTLDSVDDLIEALQAAKAKGVKTSADEIEYAQASAA